MAMGGMAVTRAMAARVVTGVMAIPPLLMVVMAGSAVLADWQVPVEVLGLV